MAQMTIRNLDEGTLASLKRRAADATKSGMSKDEAWEALERIWESMKSEPPVRVSGAELIREGREERMAAIDPRMAARKRAQ